MAKPRKNRTMAGSKAGASPGRDDRGLDRAVDPGQDPDGTDGTDGTDGEEERDEDLVADLSETQGVALIDIDDEEELESVALARTSGPDAGKQGSVAKYDPMAAYMQEIRRLPLLSREEEHELAVQLVETGDQDAARRLIEANLRLVVKIAYEYRRAYRNVLDLVQEGNVGLLQAVRKYDPFRGVKLSSYAAWWIRAYILKFILNNWRLVKIGTTQAQRKLFFNLRKEREKLERLGFRPDPKLLAERLDVTEKEVVDMERRLMAPDASLDAPVAGANDGESRTRMDLMPAQATAPDQAAAENQFQGMLKEKLERFARDLKGREQTIFRERWLTEDPLTLQQIGDQYGISRERARQIEKRLLGRLRTFLEEEFGGDVDISALSRD
jgi:RNA polymerase sigma-32 factor